MHFEQLTLGLWNDRARRDLEILGESSCDAPRASASPARKGVLGVEPLGEGGVAKPKVECRGKAFPPILLGIMSVACAILALGDVVCTWSDQSHTYLCSGEGSQVVIGGGGPSGGSPVVTNDLGSCTNCSAISPHALAQLADILDIMRDTVFDDAGDILDACTTIKDDLHEKIQEIGTFRTFSALAPAVATNYMLTTSNPQAEGMIFAYNRTGLIGNQKTYAAIGAGNGIYHYANNSVLSVLNNTYSDLYDIEQRAQHIQSATGPNNGTGAIDGIVSDMRAGAVACQGCGDGDGGGDCGGTNTTNWCTFEQGEAMKSLLSEMSNYLASCSAKLANISNYTFQAWQAIRSGLFTDYNAIPAEAQLGDWRQVYLDGNETNWGYAPTNILARIELLLYGMSGVGTNSTAYSEDGPLASTEVLDDIDNQSDDQGAQLRALDTDADGQSAQSLGSALVAFFNAFTPNTSAHADDEVIPAVSFNFNGDEIYLDALKVDGRKASVINTLRSMCSTAAGVVYVVVSGWLIFMYWRWFAEWAVKLSRWAVELITSLFAS